LAEVTPEVFGLRADEVRKLRAFTVLDVDRTVIYVNMDCSLWKRALTGDGHEFYRAVRASRRVAGLADVHSGPSCTDRRRAAAGGSSRA
jgi:hypothetical protein